MFLICRYFALYEYGGFYADLDVECLQSLDAKMAEHDCFVTSEPDIHSLTFYDRDRVASNAIMACRPRHPFFQYVADSLTRNKRVETLDVNIATGPRMLDSSYTQFKCVYPEYTPHMPEDYLFQPLPDPRMYRFYHSACNSRVDGSSWVKKLCQPYLNNRRVKASNESLTAHYWLHAYVKGSENEKYGLHGETRTFLAKDLY